MFKGKLLLFTSFISLCFMGLGYVFNQSTLKKTAPKPFKIDWVFENDDTPYQKSSHCFTSLLYVYNEKNKIWLNDIELNDAHSDLLSIKVNCFPIQFEGFIKLKGLLWFFLKHIDDHEPTLVKLNDWFHGYQIIDFSEYSWVVDEKIYQPWIQLSDAHQNTTVLKEGIWLYKEPLEIKFLNKEPLIFHSTDEIIFDQNSEWALYDFDPIKRSLCLEKKDYSNTESPNTVYFEQFY